MLLHLGAGKVRLGIGVCLGKPGDNEGGHSSLLRRGVARLGEPLRLGEGGQCLGVLACVRGLCLWLVSGRSHGPVCDYYGLLQGPLCDLFGCVIA